MPEIMILGAQCLITGKVLDARRRGVTTEAYDVYVARPPARKAYAPEGGTNEGNAADDALMVIRVDLDKVMGYSIDTFHMALVKTKR